MPNLRGFEEFVSRNPGIDGSRETIVVIDTGFQNTGTNVLGPNNRRLVERLDLVYGDAGRDRDGNGHGTAVISTIASSDARALGVAPDSNIISIKIFTDNGVGSGVALRNALEWVDDNSNRFNITAVNMSLGNGGNRGVPVEAGGLGGNSDLESLKEKGVAIFAAAGNSFSNYRDIGVTGPADDESTFGIGAISGNAIAIYSQRHPFLTPLLAPVPQTAITRTNGVANWIGTSFATPVVAGAHALANELAKEEIGRRLTPDEFVYLAQKTGVKVQDTISGYNYSELDLAALGDEIKGYSGNLNGSSIFHVWGDKRQVQEPTTGRTLTYFYVGRIGDTSKAETVSYRFVGDADLGSDFNQTSWSYRNNNQTETSRVVSFRPGDTYATVQVAVLADNLREGTEQLGLEVLPVGNDLALNPRTLIDIVNQGGSSSSSPGGGEKPPVVGGRSIFSVEEVNPAVTEGNDSLTGFRITREVGNSKVNFEFRLKGTARFGDDYLLAPGQGALANKGNAGTRMAIEFGEGVMSLDVMLRVVDDTRKENKEFISLSPVRRSDYSLGAATGRVEILDNDHKSLEGATILALTPDTSLVTAGF